MVYHGISKTQQKCNFSQLHDITKLEYVTIKLKVKKGSITAHNVHKYFHYQHQRTLKEFVQALVKKQKTIEYVHALSDLDFEIEQGESVGVIGTNGAGKSTLLSLIAGVSEATEGTLTVKGNVAPMISLGAGFHPDLSGRENIMLNGVILGLDEDLIRSKIDEIIDFSGIERRFIDTPVKFYSSGMYMRLGFSVAIFTNPDILLVDEILAVGDVAFQKKCLKKLDEFRKNNVTIVFVSHDLNNIEEFCERVIYLEHGKIVYDGPVAKGLKKFKAAMKKQVS